MLDCVCVDYVWILDAFELFRKTFSWKIVLEMQVEYTGTN